MAIDYCAQETGEHEEVLCQRYLNGGSSVFIAILKGNRIADPSDPDEINQGISEGWAKVVTGITLDIPRGSDITATNPVACGEDIVTNRTNTVNILDANITLATSAFWSAIDGTNISQIIAFDCETDFATFVNPAGLIAISAGFVMPPTNSEFQRYEATGTFRGKANTITKIPKPIGITGIDA